MSSAEIFTQNAEGQESLCDEIYLTLKVLIITAADNILILFSLFCIFQRK